MQSAQGPDFQANTFPETKMSVTLPCPVYANDIDICQPLERSKHREPVDLPAIHVDEELHPSEIVNCHAVDTKCADSPLSTSLSCSLMQCEEKKSYRKVWTCADKSRGLWTTEDGKHWCRKVQP